MQNCKPASTSVVTKAEVSAFEGTPLKDKTFYAASPLLFSTSPSRARSSPMQCSRHVCTCTHNTHWNIIK
jgi:hypothetical protein